VIALRIDAALYFGNVSFLRERIHELERGCREPLRAIVINAASVNSLDATAAAALQEIAEDLRARGVELFFAEVHAPVREVMRRAGLEALLGEDHFFLTVRRAVEAAARVTPDQAPGAPAPEGVAATAGNSQDRTAPGVASTAPL
jgi:SulP family sulfate permease